MEYRFQIVLYGRQGCHLCDQVEEHIHRIAREFPIDLRIIDIQTDVRLEEKYMLTIPVVAIDGEEVSLTVTHVMTEAELRAELKKRTNRL